MARKVGKKDSRILAKLVDGDRTPCAFCHREADDEVTYGKLYAIGDIQCHYFCVLLSCCLVQKGPEKDGLFGFLYRDILAELERCKKHKCSYCSRSGANLGCSVSSCRKQFHLPCGRERQAVSLFYGSYKSFCQSHAPKQKLPDHIMCKAKQRMWDQKNNVVRRNDNSEDMVCVICYESVAGYPAVDSFWPPCCARDAWFHRSCLGRMALSAGMHYLKCPLCNDKEQFYEAVISQGYYVPDRDAAWELEQNAFAEIYERPLRCTAETCLCPKGRSHDEDQGMWDIKLCLLCGSVGEHAHCMGASETTRYVCLTCTPAAPQDLKTLADTIEKLIMQEQMAAANVCRGPVMPSRMSLRRTKGRSATLNRPSTSRAQNVKIDCESPAPSSNTLASRQDLNLKTPRKLANSYNTSESSKNNTFTYKSPNKLSPMKQERSNEPYKTESPKYLHTIPYKSPNKIVCNNETLKNKENTESPTKADSYKNPEHGLNSPSIGVLRMSYKNLETRLLSPTKLLEQSFWEKVICMGGTAILDENVVEQLRCCFSTPRPLSEKKKLVEDILNRLFSNNDNSLKQKDPVREWSSPKKCLHITEREEYPASDNAFKITEIMVENEETPRKNKFSRHSTPIKTSTNEVKDTVIDGTKVTGDEKHQRTNNIDSVQDDSSNSTFQLPSEFIADALSDDSVTFQSPKRKMIEMKDSSLEISEQDHSVNIDVVKIDDSDVKINNSVKKRPFKFSRLTEKIGKKDVSLDLESFKKEYLSEVDRYHSINSRDQNENVNIDFRKIIDITVDANFMKKNVKSKKRKLSEGSVLLSFDNVENKAKIRKVSENDLNLSLSSDDFEIKTISNNMKNVGKPEKLKSIKNKRDKADLSKREKIRNDNKNAESVHTRFSLENKLEERNLLDRKRENKEKLIKHRRIEAKLKEKREKKLKSKIEKIKLNDESRNLLKRKKDKLKFVSKLENGEECVQIEQKKENKDKLAENITLDREVVDTKLDSKEKHKRNNLQNRKEKHIKDKKLNKEKHIEHRKLDNKGKHAEDKILDSKEKHTEDRNVDDKINMNAAKRENIDKDKSKSPNEKETLKDKLRVDDKEKYKKSQHRNKYKIHKKDKYAKDKKHKRAEKHLKDDKNIEVTIDSSESKSKQKTKTKLSISNNEKDISVKIKWKKKQLRLKIESKKAKAKKVKRDESKFRQLVLQYCSEVTPREVLVKPEKEVSPLRRKYTVKQEKTPDNLKQMSIQSFFKVRSPTE